MPDLLVLDGEVVGEPQLIEAILRDQKEIEKSKCIVGAVARIDHKADKNQRAHQARKAKHRAKGAFWDRNRGGSSSPGGRHG